MTKLIIREAYYGEYNNRQYYVYNNDKCYSLRLKKYYHDEYIYIDGKKELIENVIFSIEMYYRNKLKKDMTEEEFINKFYMYKNHINELYDKLINMYETNIIIITSVEEKLKELFNKSIHDITYETSFNGNHQLGIYMLRIGDILENEITIENILMDIYQHELSLICTDLINISIDNSRDLLEFNKITPVVYLTNYEIINSMSMSARLILDVQMLLNTKVYEYVHMNKVYNSNQLNKLCKYFNITPN